MTKKTLIAALWRGDQSFFVSEGKQNPFTEPAPMHPAFKKGETCMEILYSNLGNLTWQQVVMWAIGALLIYLAIKKEYEPLLLVPIAFGMLLVNIYPDIIASPEETSNGVGGLLYYFYVLDEYKLGNFNTDQLDTIDRKRIEIGFIERSKKLKKSCLSCPYFSICRGGCQRNRDLDMASGLYVNYFCESYKMFFDACLPLMKEVAAAAQ